MELIRTLVSSKIKEEGFLAFIQEVPNFAETVKASEPNTLQFECFANEDLNQVVWIETFKGIDGATFHLSNPALQPSQMKIMPLVEALLNMNYYGNTSPAILELLKPFGMDPLLLNAPNTSDFLKGKRTDNSIQVFTKLEVNNLSEFERLFDEIKSTSNEHEGCLFHELYPLYDSTALAVLEMDNEKNQLLWSEKFSANFGAKFQSLVNKVEMIACLRSSPSNELLHLAKQWNTSVYQKVAGFTRF